MNNITGCGWILLISPIAVVVGWIYLPGLYFVGLVMIVILAGWLAALPQTREQRIPKVDVHDPRVADLDDFDQNESWHPLWKNCLVVTFSGIPWFRDEIVVRKLLYEFQSAGCCLYVGYIGKEELDKLENFFVTGERNESGYYLNANMNDENIDKVVKGYAELRGWHEWVFGIYNKTSMVEIESKAFRDKFTEDTFQTVYSKLDAIIYCNLDMGWGSLIIVDPERFDDGIEFARVHLGYKEE